MTVQTLPLEARPREKLLARGAAALCDVELIALLLRTGLPGRGVLQMAQDLLERFGGLSGLLHTTAADLKQFKGLGGTAKRAELVAVLELARRVLAQGLREREVFADPRAVRSFLQLQLAQKSHEVFAVVFLDAHNRLLALEEMFQGTLTHASVYPREVVRRALHHNAAAVVLAHNYPGGSVEPSQSDMVLTRTLQAALALVDVRVHDHVIVAPGQTFSMAEAGCM